MLEELFDSFDDGRLASRPIRTLAVIGVLGLLIAVPRLASLSDVRLLTQILVFGLFALGYDILYGYNGVVSFGHAVFFGLGGYLFGVPFAQFGVENVWLMLILAVLGTSLIGLLIGIVSVRTRDVYFSILTLIWALVVTTIIENLQITGAHDGFSLSLPDLVLIPGTVSVSLYEQRVVYYLALVCLLLTFLIAHRLVHSPLGEVLQGGKANSNRLTYLGYDERKYRVVAFTISCGIAGFAGALQVILTGYVSPSLMSYLLSGELILWTIIGGAGTLVGPILGASVITLLEESLSGLISWWEIPVGMIFIVILIYMPEGILGQVRTLYHSWTDRDESDE
ncbi:branched-chain amino acid ABC transporter permease [Halopenitus sp. POP-27]|uniref:branched-chain amino acid ABC transporter permease n=1 Tax=Halopenitus sp. POP-27 TaxID=2994425 RepID=UPI00246997C8|nr:branched-chain amino acid ABC transporter permease [Halopenitus sp. POP-27]